MPRLTFLTAPAVALVCGLSAQAEDTRYILAPGIMQADPAPDAFRQGDAGDAQDLMALNAAFTNSSTSRLSASRCSAVKLSIGHRSR